MTRCACSFDCLRHTQTLEQAHAAELDRTISAQLLWLLGVAIDEPLLMTGRPKPRVYVRKEPTGWAFAVSDGLTRHATGAFIPTQQEALVAGLEVLGWIESGGS